MEINIGKWSNEPLSWFARVLRRLLPAANPDTEPLFHKAERWWVEINEQGLPQREIGFDESGAAVVLAPVGRNFGFIIDSSDKWEDFSGESSIAAQNFEKEWSKLWGKFRHLERADNKSAHSDAGPSS